eukprot:m.6823 g.6823  ORF g.6823 m.6823 type:complete len:472 (+) comp16966_c0_seq2:112-1527(+)
MDARGVISTIVILFAVILAVIYTRGKDKTMENILEGLLKAEKKAITGGGRPRIAVGLGSCLDVFVNAKPLFQRINFHSPSHPSHHSVITSASDLREVFGYFFERGAAADRYVSNRTLFASLVEASKPISVTEMMLGGNAAAMGVRFALEGCDVILGAQMSQTTAQKLPPSVRLANLHVEEDDVHLCIEYATGDQWGSLKSSRANRLCLHSDIHNPRLGSLEQFASKLKEFSPTLVVIGGLQMMDNYPFSFQGERAALLERLGDVLSSLPDDILVHFEMASFTDETFLNEVVRFILPHADSLGMNEQELANLRSLLEFGNVTISADSVPRVASVLDQMRSVYAALRTSRVSRIHVHTLAFQAIMTVKGSPWRNTMAAVAKAALTANRYTCNSARVDLDRAHVLLDGSFSLSLHHGNSERMSYSDARPVACWKETETAFCLAPGLVCTHVHRTAGCGDNISSASLVAQFAAAA